MYKSIAFPLLVGLLTASPVAAFHDGGVAHCNGCHTIHNSQDGTLVDQDSPNGNPWLLIDETPSDVCLGCHQNLDETAGNDPLNPPPEKGAGNFVFLLEDNLNDGHAGTNNPIPGEAAGHNVVAPGHGLFPDATLNTSPGGSFPSSALGCTSCHDPHGNDNFRLLYGAGQPVQGGLATFTSPAPEAIGISLFARELPTRHTAYLAGMSAWCQNCHGDFHAGGGRLVHPSDESVGSAVSRAYGFYNGTLNPESGDPAISYLPEVPFEDSSNAPSSTQGPSASSQVSCITCHRAHATSAPDAGRWDFNVTFLEEDGVESGSWAIPNPYDHADQRSLCNKCHLKDFGDGGSSGDTTPPGPQDPTPRREKEIYKGAS
jgi:predicted CXXCH cytochrome family protein